ncbi:MAG: hypothetical protein R3300_20340 [Candidatus Promineifilaceae bacterium]|nr:hypothetical protein [Candidatus Promineifilaceae bacterium]
MELQAIAGQLHVVDGQVEGSTSPPGLLATPAPPKASRGRQRDFLFAHLTLSGRPDETVALAQDLLDIVAAEFYRTGGSVTAALRKAILLANQRLLQLNMSGAATVREGALSCAVVRENELFVAQTGECFAILGHNFGVERLPANKPSSISPMGRTAGLDIRYFHNWLQSGDMLLLVDPRMSHLPVSAFEPALIETDVQDGIEALIELIGADSGRMILVEMTDQAPGYIPETKTVETDALEQPSGGVSQQLSPPVGQPKRSSSPTLTSSPKVDATPDKRSSMDIDTVETSARRVTSKATRSMSRATGWLADFLSALRSPGNDEEARNSWAVPAVLAVTIPLLVAVIVVGVYLQRGQAVELGNLKQQMNSNLAQGREAGNDTQSAAAQFTQVIQLADEALDLRPADPEVLRLRGEALIELDSISGVARLETRLVHQFMPEARLAAVALGDALNGDMYMLDEGTAQVFRLETEEDYAIPEGTTPESILFAEQVVGSHVVGNVVDIYWRPRGNQVSRDGLAMLDEGGALITFYPDFQDERAVSLGLASDWVSPIAATGFSERLYVLDPLANRIWRYFAEGDSLTLNEDLRAIEFVEGAELARVIDFEIYTEDGSVILLYDDGRLRRYVNGRLLWGEVDLAANGLSLPLAEPVAVQIGGRGLNSSIFVADAGNGRIVQLSLGGTYLAQYRATAEDGTELFADIKDFAVTDGPLRFFTVGETVVHVSQQP